MQRGKFFTAMLIVCGGAATGAADDVREYRDANGALIRETRRVIQRPVTTTDWQDRQQTVYRQEWRTEERDTLRTSASPVTEFRWVSRLHNRWNPFDAPYYTHHLVPVTRWEYRTEIAKVPTLRSAWAPETRTVKVPVTTQRMAEEEVITKVVLSDPPGAIGGRRLASAPTTMSQPIQAAPTYGGVAMPSDPPRQATNWRSSGSALR